MGIELGRISGPLLAENLLRNGIDLAFEDNLLYLDVTNNRIGIRKDNPGYTLDITGTTDTTKLIVDTSVNIGANLVVNTNLIQNISGAINIVPDQTTNPVITATQFGTLNLRISDQLIENITNGSDINLSPNGTGQVIFNTSKVNVDGDLHATGDITWDGSITFGDSNTDNIAITSLINSNLLPQELIPIPISEQLLTELFDPFITEDSLPIFTDPVLPYMSLYDLGSVTNKWKEVNLENLTATSISTNGVTASDINITLRVGNTWYVSKNGLDTNYGDHLNATFLTVKKALLVAEPGDEVIIFPGVYEEIFPLTVPEGVTIHGDSIRAVSITPTALTKSNDAFLLNSGATVENITVKDYYYNALANTGYAFKFASGYTFNGKSPYVRNVSVITKDFGLDLAGYGVLADGSVVNTSSTEASMLFHSCTFITPGAKALVLNNGVRVEWLNSFTYFASVGTELTNGTLGRAGLGVKFGGELRSINSANVYGDYGITANGSSTLAYIIGHNFGYIGSGLDSTNDPRNVIQANEVVESNGGKIYYESVDNKGDVRVGNIFYVSQETGQVSFDASAINFASNGSIVLEGPTSSTYIQAAYVQTGNIRLHDNTVESLAGLVNLTAQSGSTYLNTNVFVTGNLSITNDVKVKGNVYLGDTPLDLITIVPDLTQDINPDVTDSFTLGTDSKRWNNLFIKLVNVDNVTEITTNTISTLTTDTDLKFVAAGTGEIHVATTNVQVDNDLTTATGTAATATLGALTTVTAGTFNTGDITISGHTITTTVTDSDLELSANGIISVPLNPVKIDQNLTVTALTTLTNVNIGTALNTALVEQIGNYTQTGDKTIYGDVEISNNVTFLGEAQFNDFNINTNTLSTTTVDGDLKLGANGLGIVNVQTTNVLVNNDLTVSLNISTGSLTTVLGTTTAGTFTTGDITISDNTINTTVTNSNLLLKASTGNIVSISTNDVDLSQKLTVTGKTTVTDVNIGTALAPKLLQQIGSYTQTGNKLITGDYQVTSNATFTGEAQFYNINVNTNVISTTLTDTDLRLQANGSGIIQVKTTDVQIDNDLTVGTNLTINGTTSLKDTEIGVVGTPKTLTLVGNLNQTGDTDITGLFANNNISIVGSSYLTTSDIKINSNEISVLSTNNDLNIVGATTGGVVVENQLKILNNVISNVRSGATTDTQQSILLSPNGTGNTVINSTKSLVIPVGNSTTRSMSTGEIRFNNLTGLYEGAISTGLVSFFNIYDSDRNTYITPELTLGANDNTIRFGINSVVRGTITSTALITSNYNIDNVSITSNTLSNVNPATDLNIATAGTGRILINSLPVKDSKIINTTNSALVLESTTTSSGAGYIKFGGTGAVVFPYGPTEDRRLTPEIGETRYNSTLGYLEVFDGTSWLSAAGGAAGATLAYIEEELNLWSIVLG